MWHTAKDQCLNDLNNFFSEFCIILIELCPFSDFAIITINTCQHDI